MRRSKGVSTFVATLVLVTISLSLSYVVYEGVSRLAAPRQVVYSNSVATLPGSPDMADVTVGVSSPSQPLALVVGNASSSSGVLFFNGASYGASDQLCSPGTTTFFSVFTGAGTLQLAGNGRAWIDGYWTSSLPVQAGWQEVMFSGSSSCSVVDTNGLPVTYGSSDLSSVPLTGSVPSAQLSFYVPSDGATPQILLVFNGGYDQVA